MKTVSLDLGKQINVVCPVTRAIVSRALSSASSSTAGEFLREVFREMPVCFKSVQVDTGSEFRGEFEEVAKELGVKISVLPARSMELNGMVEHLNRTLRGAFYSGDVGPYVSQAINELLKEFVRYDKEERCHTAIGGVPPLLSGKSFGIILYFCFMTKALNRNVLLTKLALTLKLGKSGSVCF